MSTQEAEDIVEFWAAAGYEKWFGKNRTSTPRLRGASAR